MSNQDNNSYTSSYFNIQIYLESASFFIIKFLLFLDCLTFFWAVLLFFGLSYLITTFFELSFSDSALKFRAPNLSNSLIKIGYQNSKYRDFFNEVSSDLPMMFLTHDVLGPINKEKKWIYTLITVSIFSKIIIELYEKVGKICLRRYRKIFQKWINFCKITFSCKNSDQSQLI